MTTADEPVLNDQIASLEATAQRYAAAVATSPLVNGKARPLLEEIAFHSARLPWADAVAKAAVAHVVDDCGRGTSLHRLLTDSGAVAENRFVPDGLSAYLSACHVVRRQPGGPSWFKPRREFLRPQTDWPWPDSETQLYLVALWWPVAETTIRRRLTALLSPRHRHPNVHFVAELVRRNLVPANDLRERTVAILHEHLATPRRASGDWRTTVATLLSLEPAQAADALEQLALRRSASPLRRLEAADELAELDLVRGEDALRELALSLSGDPYEQLEVAKTIRHRDEELGARSLRLLADSPDLGDLRAEAAILTGDTELWSEKVARGALSDTARLKLLTALADADPEAAVAAAEPFARTVNHPATAVKIAKKVRTASPETALRIADAVAWPDGREVAGSVRLEAVHVIGELVPTRLFKDLARLSHEVPDEATQLQAALDLADQGGTSAPLRDFAANPRKDRDHRTAAARRVAKADPRAGGQLLVKIAQTYKPSDPLKLKLLAEAREHAPAAAREALEKIAGDTRRPPLFRVEAVERGRFDRTKTLRLYEHIATSTSDKEAARLVARKVAEMDRDAGEKLLGRLAAKFTASPAFQLSLAREAGASGKTALRRIAERPGQADWRMEALTALLDLDGKLGAAVIAKIVRTRRGGEIRVRAACLLPQREALEALLHIVGDQDRDDVLVAAAEKALGLDRERAKRALRELVERRGLSPRARTRVHRMLDG